MDRERDLSQEAVESDGAQWVCRNCGSFNARSITHCEQCGFAAGYNPEAPPTVPAASAPAFFVPREELPARVVLYMSLLQLLAVLAIAALLIPVLWRLHTSWPFQSPYERDAGQLASRLMSLSVRTDMGITKAAYDSELAQLLGESERFKGTYEATPERIRESYQKLVQSAEFFRFAGDSWTAKLTAGRYAPAAAAEAASSAADPAVKEYWQRAKSSATGALADLS